MRYLTQAFGIFSTVLVMGCSVAPPGVDVHDPYENTNRKLHAFNKGLDRVALRPAANVYDAVLPDPVEDSVSNFASNLSLPGKVVNHVLQGDLASAGKNTLRFVFNSTIGLGGLLDASTEFGLAEVDTDFGETLQTWGVREGAYVELPVFGPSTEREATGIVVDMFLDPMSYVLPTAEAQVRTGARVGEILQTRHNLGRQIDSVLYESADSYAQARLIYLQNRRFEVGGGATDAFIDPYAEFE